MTSPTLTDLLATDLLEDREPFVPENIVEELTGTLSGGEPPSAIHSGLGGDLIVKTIRGEIKAKSGDVVVAVPNPAYDINDPDSQEYLGLYVLPPEVVDLVPDPPPVEPPASA